MSEDQKYNGWTNYETWAANLWLDGMTLEELIDPSEYANDSEDWRMISYAAEALKEYVEEFNPLVDEATMYSDLLNASIRAIDYREIVEHYVEDWRYDNPRMGSKANPCEFEITSSTPDNVEQYWPLFVETKENDDLFERGGSDDNGFMGSFWWAFDRCIEHALENGMNSIVIEWDFDQADIVSYLEWKADQLIKAQSNRNIKTQDK